MNNRHIKGFTLVEALAGIVIVSFVFVSTLTILFNIRVNTIRTSEKVIAMDIGRQMRQTLERDVSYADMSLLVINNDLSVTKHTCDGVLNLCEVFDVSFDDTPYEAPIEITFLQATATSTLYEVIHFEITIHYFRDHTITLSGVLYE